MQVFAQIPLPQPVAKPTCLIWYPGDACDEQLQQYRQVLEQHQRQEWQNSVTTRYEKQIADQQKQIADQQAQIKTLQSKIESQTMDALQSQARSQAFLDGLGVIIGTTLAFLVVVAVFRKLAGNAPAPPQEEGRAASA